MTGLIDGIAEAKAWVERVRAGLEKAEIYGRIVEAVIWSDARDAAGNLLVAIDPAALAANINAGPYPLLLGHDPGRPMGKVLAAEVFRGVGGETFVAALLGFYDSSTLVSFGELGLDPEAAAAAPATLPDLSPRAWIELHADPREVEPGWFDELIATSPLPAHLEERSHNAADVLHALIVVGLPYAALVWNPFVTTVATEAGKDLYAGVRAWMKTLVARMAEHRQRVLEIQSSHGACHVSFMLRGQDVARHYKAHDALPEAAARAVQLLEKMRQAGLTPVRLVYEFHATEDMWHPSYAELHDGRLISDNAALIAVERLPQGLSLGLSLRSIEAPDL